MKLSFVLLSGLLSLTTVTIQAQEVTKELNVRSFDRINIGSAIDVTVRQGGFNVEVDLPTGESKYLDVKTDNNTLTVRLNRPPGNWLSSNQNRKSPHITITMPSLQGVTLSGASDGNISGFTNTDQLDINLSGSSDLKMTNVRAKRIRLKASGASDSVISGETDVLEAEISGASDLSASNLIANEVVVRAQGASDASVYARRKVEKYARGGSDISVRGNPSTVHSNKLD
ncbi:head GIN domain-containing protein [Tellurirhabdus bombi]|uniref:head GIN domain-containing protein n=1 Tax=Tellurirhabdus bombi TaxID=2907205 RepID=UPI001F39D130|nr:head GIN domain-containing protein [Tellurirhabdus bombi]